MNSAGALTFLWTPWSLATSAFVLASMALLCALAWRRSGYGRGQGMLELLRFAIAALVVVLLNQPEWVETYEPTEKPTVAILHDDSHSMATRDARRGDSSTGEWISRREAIATLIDPQSWESLKDKMEIVVEPFSSDDAKQGTNIEEPLATAPERLKNLQAIVLASDGDWNEGQPPVIAASKLRLKGIPVITVPVGSTSRLPDVELLSLEAPTFAVRGKALRIPFTIDSSLPREYVTTVVLKTGRGEEVTREVRVAPMGRTSDALLWMPKEIGDDTLTLTLPKQSEEILEDNNSLSMPIAIREEKLRVLVVESLPRWEYRYLRNALSRDPGIDLSCLIFHPGLSKQGGGTKDYIKSFPSGLEELGKYDVVFLGDVGIVEGQLTAEDCRLLRGIVEHQASGLVFMPGWQGRQHTLLQTELADLYPVVLDETQLEGWGSRSPCQFELTELGRRSLLTKLADTQDDNVEVWDGLPGFQWYAPVVRAKAGVEVLCVHKEASNDFGRLPLLVTRTFGAGKILFMGTDGAWRWRKGVEDKYHYRFWGQVVRWMAYQRNMAKGETMRLYYSPEQPLVRQSITFNANVMERSGEPLVKGEVTGRIVSPTGKAQVVRFDTTGDEWGAFTARYVPDEPGQHRVVLSCKQTDAELDAAFYVQGGAVERVGKPARLDVLEEIASVTKGSVASYDKLDAIIQALAKLPEPVPIIRRVQLWCHPLAAAALIGLLGTFWTARKMMGLI